MEKEITNILDNLTVEQTERWIDDSMEMKLNSRDRRRIKNAVFEKTGSKKRQRAALPRKLAACAAAFAVVFASLAVIGFDNVAAAIQKLFTFVPGIGIVEKDDADIYTAELLTGYIQTENAKVTFVNAVYADGILAVQIAVAGKETNREHFFEDYTVYINQKSINLADVIQLCGSASDYYDTAFYFEKETAPPKEGDIFEVAVAGFSERISFSMVPCRDYDDFAKIGPYDTQNGISLVTTAQRFGDQLAVWCYPHQTAESAYKNDEICGIGFASPSSVVFYPPGGWEKWSANPDEYIQTPGGKIPQNMDDNGLNRQYKNRLLFDLPESEKSATLHIPYLSMTRREKPTSFTVRVPEGYDPVPCDIPIKLSLGTLRITEVYKTAAGSSDRVRVKFVFESQDKNVLFNTLEAMTTSPWSKDPWPAAGELNLDGWYLEAITAPAFRETKEVTFTITDINYYLLGEYVIPLDIQ